MSRTLNPVQSSALLGFLRLCSGLLLLQVSLPAKAQPLCPAHLSEAIAPIVSAPQFRRAHWGILVQTVQSQTLYAQNAEDFFTPASNAKLLTTAAALTRLGSQFRIRTSVYQIGQPTATQSTARQSTANILRVVGRGDPSLKDLQLRDLAQQIRDRGITQIDRLVLDDQYFRGDAINPTWEWEDIQAGYGAVANSLIVNQNAIGLTLVPQKLGEPLQVVWDDPSVGQLWQINNLSKTVAAHQPEFLQVGRAADLPILQVEGQLQVGSAAEPIAISVPQPTSYFADRFQQALKLAGVQVRQTQTIESSAGQEPVPLTQAIEIAAVESAPLSELLVETNQESNNLYAEAILRSMGAIRVPQAISTLEAGLNEVKAALSQIGVVEGYQLSDGSGLSRRNLVSPAALVGTLQAMGRSPYALTYQNTLSVAGVSGTLRNRFRASSVQGRLQGKTGFLSSAAALSGYLQPPNYPPVTFSILVNQFDQPIGEVQQAIDNIVEILENLQPC